MVATFLFVVFSGTVSTSWREWPQLIESWHWWPHGQAMDPVYSGFEARIRGFGPLLASRTCQNSRGVAAHHPRPSVNSGLSYGGLDCVKEKNHRCTHDLQQETRIRKQINQDFEHLCKMHLFHSKMRFDQVKKNAQREYPFFSARTISSSLTQASLMGECVLIRNCGSRRRINEATADQSSG